MRKGSHLSEETKEKLRQANLGKKASPEVAEMLRTLWIGRKHTDATKEKMRQSALGEKNQFFGKKHTPEALEKMSRNRPDRHGDKHPMWGKHHTPEAKKKISIAELGHPCYTAGKPLSEETRKKIGDANRGPKCKWWKGGNGTTPYSPGFTQSLRKKIRSRDGFVCMICGKEQTTKAHDVHHIDYHKNNHSPSNLVTLCHPCHMMTNLNKDKWLAYFGKI